MLPSGVWILLAGRFIGVPRLRWSVIPDGAQRRSGIQVPRLEFVALVPGSALRSGRDDERALVPLGLSLL
jgi:hypothetical protein